MVVYGTKKSGGAKAANGSVNSADPSESRAFFWAVIIFAILMVILLLAFAVTSIVRNSRTRKSVHSPLNGGGGQDEHVCLEKKTLEGLLTSAAARASADASTSRTGSVAPPTPLQPSHVTPLYTRDSRVLHDQLYPPLNRSEAHVLANLPHHASLAPIGGAQLLQHQQPPRTEDTFRLLGYLKSDDVDTRDAGNNVWKCMGRMKDRHTGEFYAVPANNNEDLKIPLTPDIVTSEKLKDVYSLPTEMRFRSPFFNPCPYTFVELPKSDFTSTTYL
jgi:hypothetical protein